MDDNIWLLTAIDDREDRVVNQMILADQLEKLGALVNRKIGDNSFNGYLRGFAANRQAQAQRDEAAAQGANILLTHFIAGTVQPDPHLSWMYVFNNEVIRDWLFSQRK